jgi:hypothetical protein
MWGCGQGRIWGEIRGHHGEGHMRESGQVSIVIKTFEKEQVG